MVSIVRRMQERELLRLLALLENSSRHPNATEHQAAPDQLGALSIAGGSAVMPRLLRPRVGLETSLEPRRRGAARFALRSDGPARRTRRRDVYLRAMPEVDATAAIVALTPQLLELALVRADDLLTICRALVEVLDRLDGNSRARGDMRVAHVDKLAGRGDRSAEVGRAQTAGKPGRPARASVASAPAASRGYPGGLTRREVEVLLLVAEGLISKEIAAELCVAVPTVSRHLANIYAKIDARGRADATRYALEHLPAELAARQEDRLG